MTLTISTDLGTILPSCRRFVSGLREKGDAP